MCTLRCDWLFSAVRDFAMDLPQFDSRSAGKLLAGAERFERLAARTDLNQGLRDRFRQLADEARPRAAGQ